MGELEATVMDTLWRDGGWMTPGDVHDAIGHERDLAYTTVMTILVRLCNKGRLERERRGRAFAYHPIMTRAEHSAARMREILAAAGDRTSALNHFVKKLRPAERAELRRLLAERKP
ncbi:MAG: BlaI/MecI/CopY family transcriptional regulator [Actinobacteria bacterium]|nr:BlaI/MecI/CopY family transcriptional regulator [Actinomycetota bacterium]